MSIAANLVNNHLLNDDAGLDTINGNNISLSGATYSLITKLGSHSVFFRGSLGNDIATQQATTNLDASSEFALACWFKPSTSQVSAANIMGIRVDSSDPAGSGQGIALVTVGFTGTSSTLTWFVRDTSFASASIITTKSYKDNNWHLLIVGRDSLGQSRINVDNGDSDLSVAGPSGSWWESGDFFKLGAFNNTTQRFRGNIDNVNTFDKWPDAADIAEIWNGGAGVEFGAIAAAGRRRRMLLRSN